MTEQRVTPETSMSCHENMNVDVTHRSGPNAVEVLQSLTHVRWTKRDRSLVSDTDPVKHHFCALVQRDSSKLLGCQSKKRVLLIMFIGVACVWIFIKNPIELKHLEDKNVLNCRVFLEGFNTSTLVLKSKTIQKPKHKVIVWKAWYPES